MELSPFRPPQFYYKIEHLSTRLLRILFSYLIHNASCSYVLRDKSRIIKIFPKKYTISNVELREKLEKKSGREKNVSSTLVKNERDTTFEKFLSTL